MADTNPAPGIRAQPPTPSSGAHHGAPTVKPSPDLQAFLSLGFRPLYIAGCGWALISLAIWIFAPALIRQPMWGVAWHAHEMLWGFIATIAVGFLLTASATWTGFNPLKGLALGAVCTLWVIARIGYLAGGDIAFHVALCSETLFFGIASLCLLRVVVKGKSRRNLGLPFLTLGLGAANLLYALAAQDNDYIGLMQRFEQGLICMAIIALLIARRVIPFFSMRMLPGLDIPMLVRSGRVQMVLSVAAIAFSLIGWPIPMALALAATGLVGLWQLLNWKPLAVLRKPMLWILYMGYAALAIGLVFAAAYAAGLTAGTLARAAVHVHIVGIGGFSVLIIGMVTRTALGHLGRPLALDTSMLASYYLMIAAFVLRLAALAPGEFSLLLLQASALCWTACMALYLWRFVPLLIRPRPDGR
ncbi:NnrS family protein [Allopusillimonas ginsengisoli]|uniref:NnrS family protein n=1 Tax=Allopusillimonas ginsengisoli TaxID=453575 RepID=UPI00101F24BD|nr:NnrS family protein [Allopusillimonas ginsengisoli]TEA77510.1 NnrS family protein [Allopusillimonas ginsengisoli]